MNYFITGSNRGLGYSLTEAAVKEGNRVIATVRQYPKTGEPLSLLKEKYPDQITIICMDVAGESSVEAASKQVKETVGVVDVLINNVGVLAGRDEKIEELNLDKIGYCFDINVQGPIRVVKHILPLLKKSKSASLINISSDTGSLTNAWAGDYAYGISKAALNMFSAKLHRDLKNTNIYVWSIHPGWMRTDMGGSEAHLDPMESAQGILKIIHERKEVAGSFGYLDYTGEEMEI